MPPGWWPHLWCNAHHNGGILCWAILNQQRVTASEDTRGEATGDATRDLRGAVAVALCVEATGKASGKPTGDWHGEATGEWRGEATGEWHVEPSRGRQGAETRCLLKEDPVRQCGAGTRRLQGVGTGGQQGVETLRLLEADPGRQRRAGTRRLQGVDTGGLCSKGIGVLRGTELAYVSAPLRGCSKVRVLSCYVTRTLAHYEARALA